MVETRQNRKLVRQSSIHKKDLPRMKAAARRATLKAAANDSNMAKEIQEKPTLKRQGAIDSSQSPYTPEKKPMNYRQLRFQKN
uniref:Uncharacterized protein n=1 Tax=Plectus sambesii TaxID=2011161 RepID=A0A914UHR5_9BILA